VDLYRLTNRHGLSAAYHQLRRNRGVAADSRLAKASWTSVVLGYDSLAGYLSKSPYVRLPVDGYGKRIAKASQARRPGHSLAKNDGENHLHGGKIGFDKVVWSAKPIPCEDRVGLAGCSISARR